MLRLFVLVLMLATSPVSFGGVLFGVGFGINQAEKFCTIAYPKSNQTQCMLRQSIILSNVISLAIKNKAVYVACLRVYADNYNDPNTLVLKFFYGINWEIFHQCMVGIIDEK